MLGDYMTIYTVNDFNTKNESVTTYKKSLVISVLLVFFVFLLLSVVLGASYLSYIGLESKSFLNWLYYNLFLFAFDVSFFFAFIYTIVFTFKKPAKFIGELVSKELDKDGHYLMHFELEELNKKEIVCYTEEENSFNVYSKYILYIKELSHVIKSIENFDETKDKDYKLSKSTKFFNGNKSGYMLLLPMIIALSVIAIGGIIILFVALLRHEQIIYLVIIDIVLVVVIFLLIALLSGFLKKDD